jgi:hypothetical protein
LGCTQSCDLLPSAFRAPSKIPTAPDSTVDSQLLDGPGNGRVRRQLRRQAAGETPAAACFHKQELIMMNGLNPTQAGTLAQVIPVLGLALGLEMRELRKGIDQLLVSARGKHHFTDGSEAPSEDSSKNGDEASDELTDSTSAELQISIYSRFTGLALFSCIAMLILLKGEQQAIIVVLGGSANQVTLDYSLRIALTIIFLSPVAQMAIAYTELIFRRSKTKPATRAKVLAGIFTIMTSLAYSITFIH